MTSAEGLSSTKIRVANGGRREGLGVKRRSTARDSKHDASCICPVCGANYYDERQEQERRESLLKRHENDPFLKRIITGDEKWVVYNNVKRRGHGAKKNEPAQTISKADIYQKKVMLFVWWDFKGIVYLELLPDNTTINSEVYCHQPDKLNDALQQKRSELINRKGVVFHQDNAGPHTSLVTRQKLLQLEWDTMPHPPYSPDLAPSDYYLFRSLQTF
ncbi:histone-lysine N-methyltransferase SETMAR [Trichonephila clavipes]|nr:histone-lysine N-methyltransferase SETMAR [Trichonephila clavipes]